MIVFFNFVHLSSAMKDNNTDPVTIWRQLRLVETACRRKDDNHKKNIELLINLLSKNGVHTNYEIFTYSATILAT
jgi:hypothetical protein